MAESRTFARIDPRIWRNQMSDILESCNDSTVTYLFIYLLTSPNSNMIGVYNAPLSTVSIETGLKQENVLMGYRMLHSMGHIVYDNKKEFIWIREMAKWQIGEKLSTGDTRVKLVSKMYESLPELIFLADFYDYYHDSYNLKNRRDNRKIKGFNPPYDAPYDPKYDDPYDAQYDGQIDGPYNGTSCHRPPIEEYKNRRIEEYKDIRGEGLEEGKEQEQQEQAPLAPSLPSVAQCDNNSSFIHNVMNDKPNDQRVINAPRVGEWIYCKGKKTKRVMTTQSMVDIFEFWRTTMDKSLMTQLDFSRAESIQFALENFDVETCKQAIVGCTKSPWHMGKDPKTKGEKFNDLTNIFKDIAKTEGFISKSDKQETEEGFVEAWTRIASMA